MAERRKLTCEETVVKVLMQFQKHSLDFSLKEQRKNDCKSIILLIINTHHVQFRIQESHQNTFGKGQIENLSNELP